jgi:putative transposase
MMCKLYGVTRAGYYAWRVRGCSNREKSNALLAEQIRQAHQSSRGTYGSPRIYWALRNQGCLASENRIARIMRKHGIKAGGNHSLHQSRHAALLRPDP